MTRQYWTEDYIKIKKQKQVKSPSATVAKRTNVEKPKQKNVAYCIRCGGNLPFNIEKPLCKDCYSEWAEYKNEDYEENFCHHCGKDKDVTFAKPVCYNCYKQLYK